MVLCREWSLVKEKGSVTEVEPLRCKCWHCIECQPIRSKRLVRECMEGEPRRFLTLTVNPDNYRDGDDAARAMVDGWREMRRLIRLYYDADAFPFFAVFEATKKGTPHLHILLRGWFIPQWLIAAWWRDITGSRIVDIRFIRQRRSAARYVGKYVGKGPNQYRGCKRYWRSLDWFAPCETEDGPDEREAVRFSVSMKHWTELLQSYSSGPWVVDWDGPDASNGFRVYRVPP